MPHCDRCILVADVFVADLLPHSALQTHTGKRVQRTDRQEQERLMEVYAGFLEHTDYQMGRVVGEVGA